MANDLEVQRLEDGRLRLTIQSSGMTDLHVDLDEEELDEKIADAPTVVLGTAYGESGTGDTDSEE